MNNYYHVSPIDKELFWVYSNEADYRYIVQLENPDQMDKAMEIAEREASRWGGGFSEEFEEDSDEYSYYHNAGYLEVVEDALNKAGIEADFYTLYEREDS